MEIPKTYNPKEVENKIYKLWEESGFFTPENLPDADKGNFVAAIAPPNITGELHMGHALEHTLQDIIFRMKRMQGYKTLWLPGTDHAGIAAQNVVEKQLAKEGLTRHDLGREKFLEKMWEWRDKYGNAILNQLKKLGLSLDWTRLKFTMDPDYQKAVENAFLEYHKKGWIYKGERVINWCVRCATAISDLEVNYVPEKTKLYYIKFGPFVLATTRPETRLGDTGLAVHPDDKRYKKYVGEEIELETIDNETPLPEKTKAKKIKLKVVADESVDPEFGGGIVKVTPAHDITDSEIGQRHNLQSIKIINENGKMNESAGKRYEGMKIAEAREQIVKDMQGLGLIEKIEDYEHNLARCDRCNSIIEPLPSKQWFLKMKDLAEIATKAIENKEVKIIPEKWGDQALNWLKNIRDWNISRQLWWGHEIPLEGESDVLDTWFSSALWPLATLGWPNEKTKDFKEYYPTDFITSDRNIIFLWQIRMIFSGKYFTGQVPFKNLYIHPTVLTKEGKRMSKSLGTGINPLELIDECGADALRFALAYQTTALQDLKFSKEAVMMGKKFANKLWNISRYIIMRIGDEKITPKNNEEAIVSKLNETTATITKNIENYQFGEASHLLYDFVWHDFADKYLEETKDKNDKETKETLLYVLVNSLKLLHPFMPFVTEEIYSKIPLAQGKKLLLVENWPH